MRTSEIIRHTKETDIKVTVSVDPITDSSIKTGIPFLNHMLDAFSFYSGLYLNIQASGDLDIDDHHTVEDIGIVLGQAIKQLIVDENIERFGSFLMPMDEALSRVVIDISNRPYLVYKVKLNQKIIGGLSLENVKEFFRAFVNESRVTLHIETLYGDNDHHIVESIFKAFGKALKEALCKTEKLQSIKGVI